MGASDSYGLKSKPKPKPKTPAMDAYGLARAFNAYAAPRPTTPLASALSDYADRVGGDFRHGLDESAQGFGEMMQGQFSTGIPRTVLGGLGWMGSPVSGALSPILSPILEPVAGGIHDYVGKPIENATGYPADLTTELALALALPKALHGAGKVTNAAIPYLARIGDEVGIRPTPPGQYNMFIGGRAKNFPHDMVPKAEKLEAEGISQSDIHDMTGLHRGVDGKWRAEIDDSGMKLTRRMDRLPQAGTTIGDAVDHPELFANYPELANLRLVEDGGNRGGASYRPARDGETNGVVSVGSEAFDKKSVTAHELMHAVQDIEGFARGANPDQFRYYKPEIAKPAADLRQYADMLDSWEKGIEAFKKVYGREPDPETVQLAYDAMPDKLHDAANPDFAYRRTAGEVEARNVQNRLKMNNKDRRASFPAGTEDIPRSVQSVRQSR